MTASSPAGPVAAAARAMAHGGFTTPAIEAVRILDDALRTLRHTGGLSTLWQAEVRATLAWIDVPENYGTGVPDLGRLSAAYGDDWRGRLEAALASTGTQPGRADVEPFPLDGPPWAPVGPDADPAAAPARAVRVITPEPRSRLDALLEQRDLAKAEAEKARDALSAIEDGIKYELARQLREGETKVEVSSPHLARPLRLTYVESWRVDATKLKAEAPETYARYAKKSGSWKLAPVGTKAGGS